MRSSPLPGTHRRPIARLLLMTLGSVHWQTADAQNALPGCDNTMALCDEVIVTTQHREQDIATVPISITRLDGRGLQRDGIVDLSQLTTQVAGFAANSQGIPSLYLRGIGSNDLGAGGDPSVGVYQDGVYLGRSTGAVFDLVDVERIEVVRGPQGVLFGRNSAGGAINIVTRKADPRGDSLSLATQWGRFNEQRFTGIGNLAINDELAWRVAADSLQRDGYIHNAYFNNDLVGADQWAVRTSASFQVSAQTLLQLQAGAEDKHSDGTSSRSTNPRYLGGTPFDDYFSDLDHGFEQRQIRHATGHAQLQLGRWQLRSSTSYRTVHYADLVDSTGTGLFARRLYAGTDERHRQFGQEALLTGDVSLWNLKQQITAGASYYRQHVHQQSHLESTSDTVNFAVSRQRGVNLVVIPPGRYHEENSLNFGDGRSLSAFVDITTQWSPHWQLTTGLRYSDDRKRHAVDGQGSNNGLAIVFPNTPEVTGNDRWHDWSPRMGVNYLRGNLLVYGQYSEGYKSGGFNSFVANAPFAPEHIDQFELGSKWHSARRQLWWQAAAFDYGYRDLQVSVIESGQAVIRNAARAHGQGVDVEFGLQPHPQWRASISASWLSATFAQFVNGNQNLAGKRLTFSPDQQFGLLLEHERRIGGLPLSASLRYSYSGQQYFDVNNTPSASENAVKLLDATLSLTSANGRWRGTLYGKNLTDTRYVTFIGGLAKDTLDAPASKRGLPRTGGIRLEANFR